MNEEELSESKEDEPQPYLSSIEPTAKQVNATQSLLNQFDEQYKKNNELFDSPDSCKMNIESDKKEEYFSFKGAHAQPATTVTAPTVEVGKKSMLIADLQKEFNSLNSKINGLENKIKENTNLVNRARSISASKKLESRASALTGNERSMNKGKVMHVSSSIDVKKGTFKGIGKERKIDSMRSSRQTLSASKKMERHITTPSRQMRPITKKPQMPKAGPCTKKRDIDKENCQSNNKSESKEMCQLKKDMVNLIKKAKCWEDKYNRLYKEHMEMKAEYDSSEAMRKKQSQLIKNLRNQLNVSNELLA